MSNKNHHLRSSLFLLELVVLLLFFGICGGICVNLFAAADRLSRESQSLSMAVVLAENGAEQLKTQTFEGEEGTWAQDTYYDGQGELAAALDEKGYVLRIEASQTEYLLSAELIVFQEGRELYRLPVARAASSAGGR